MINTNLIDLLDFIFSFRNKKTRVIGLCVAAGMTQREMAKTLKLSPTSVCKHIKKIKKVYQNSS